MNLLGFCSLNLSTYCSLSLLHKENIVDVVVVVVALAGEEVTFKSFVNTDLTTCSL